MYQVLKNVHAAAEGKPADKTLEGVLPSAINGAK